MMELGNSQPSLTTIFELSKALKVKPSDLIRMVEMEYEKMNE
ncbi:hypothetical protein GRP75_07505 [Paenibacillus sp. OT2-17]|nr:hypothetical protein [Paenibacillus sp. OT2-17]